MGCTLLGDANPNVGVLQSEVQLAPIWWRDKASSPTDNSDELWSRGRLVLGFGSATPIEPVWYEPYEGTSFGGGHTINVLTDQLDVHLCEVATNWATIGTWTTAPNAIDDNRLEGALCLQGRNSNVKGWAGVIMPAANACWQWKTSTDAYVDLTNQLANSTASDVNPWPTTESVGDRMYIGWKAPFGSIVFTLGTSGTVGTMSWKYWNGSTWAAVTGLSDGTTGLTAAGTVSWTVPTDWVPRSLNGSERMFYIAGEVTGLYTVNPVITQGLLTYASGNDGYSIYMWINNACPAATNTFADGGLRLTASSDLTPTLTTGTYPNNGPTNSRQWWASGSDGLRTSGFVPYVFNPSIAGSLDLGSPSLTKIRRIGFGIGMLSTIGASTTNIFWDAVRIGSGLILRYGTSDTANTFADIFNADYSIGSMWGVVGNTNGIYFVAGKLYMGQSDQTDPMYFADTDQVVVFRNGPISTTFNEIRVVGLSGKTSTFKLGAYSAGVASNGCTIKGAARTSVSDPSPAKSVWSLTSSDTYAVTLLYGSAFADMYRASLNSSSEVRSCTFAKFGDITANGALFDDCVFQDLQSAAPISATYGVKVQTTAATITNSRFVACATALLWDVNTDTITRLASTSFTSGGTGHGIELGTNVPSSITLTSNTFTSYGADATTNAAIYNNSGKAVTINIVGGTTPTIRNGAGASTILVVNPVDTTITVVDITTGSPISGARVLITASDNTGPMPYQEAVTSITRAGAIATVAHTAHGLVDGKKVLIKGANQQEYNGVFTLTYIDANSYSYTVSGAPTTPATGTIVATGVVIDGTTNGSGVVTDNRAHASNQPITGRVRKATAGTLYKTGSVSGTVSSATGFSTTIQLIVDA